MRIASLSRALCELNLVVRQLGEEAQSLATPVHDPLASSRVLTNVSSAAMESFISTEKTLTKTEYEEQASFACPGSAEMYTYLEKNELYEVFGGLESTKSTSSLPF